MRQEATLTVEQLAYETGMSVRNIRNHQSRGLLPPPEVRARIGYYGPQHVARLRLIQEMQGEGFKLSAISRLIGEHGADADRFVGLRQAVTAPFATEAPEVLTARSWPSASRSTTTACSTKAQKLGLLIDLGDERYEAPSPALLQAAEDVLKMGIEPVGRPCRDREAKPQFPVLGPHLRQSLRRGTLEALRRSRPSRRGLGRDHRVDRTPPPARGRGPQRNLPPHPDDRSGESLRRSPRTAQEEVVPG